MRKEDVLSAYKILAAMKDLTDKLDEALKKDDVEKALKLKSTLIEMQRRLQKTL